MELTHSALIGFRTKFLSAFNQALNLAKPKWDKIATKIDSGLVEQVTHRWMLGIPGMREFLDERTFQNLSTGGVTIINRIWELTTAIKRADLERDPWGVYDPLMAKIAQTSALHKDVIAFGLLSDALATPSSVTAYDGLNFFGNHNDAIRVKNHANYNNLASAALAEASLTTAITQLRQRKDNQGNLLAASQSKPLLIIPPALEFTAAKLNNLSFLVSTQPGTGVSSATSQAAASENILKGQFDYEVSAYLKTATEWHLVLTDPYCKPLVMQIEKDIEVYSYEKFLTQWTEQDKFCIGTYARYNVGLVLPEMIYSSSGTA